MNTFSMAVAELSNRPLAIDRARLESILSALKSTDEPRAALPRKSSRQEPQGRAGVLPLTGVITYGESVFSKYLGGTALELWIRELQRLGADSSIERIIIPVSSPGGTVDGVPEAAALVRQVAKRKPVVAIVNPFAASGAYWIISGASQIVSLRSGEVGSIGVFVRHEDLSEANRLAGVDVTYVESTPEKTETSSDKPLSKDATAFLQERVNTLYSQFVGDVARGQRTTPAKVKRDYGGGRMVLGPQALVAGMVDKLVGSYSEGVRIASRTSTVAQAAIRREAELRELELEVVSGCSEHEIDLIQLNVMHDRYRCELEIQRFESELRNKRRAPATR